MSRQLDEDDDGPELKITKRAEKMPLDGMPPDMVLAVEVFRRIKRATEKNADCLCERLVGEYGSVKNAITAIRSGDVQFTRTECEGLPVWTAVRNGHEIITVEEAMWNKALLHMERMGLFEKVRDKDGHVVMKRGKNGKLQVLWQRTDLALTEAESRRLFEATLNTH